MITHQQLIDIATPTHPPVSQHQVAAIDFGGAPAPIRRGCGERHSGACPTEVAS